jgi:hypothetical protein
VASAGVAYHKRAKSAAHNRFGKVRDYWCKNGDWAARTDGMARVRINRRRDTAHV